MDDGHASLLDVLPDGQRMPKREPYIVEVLFVPLPANEMDERRRRLRALLLTGAVGWHRSTGNPFRCPQSPRHRKV